MKISDTSTNSVLHGCWPQKIAVGLNTSTAFRICLVICAYRPLAASAENNSTGNCAQHTMLGDHMWPCCWFSAQYTRLLLVIIVACAHSTLIVCCVTWTVASNILWVHCLNCIRGPHRVTDTCHIGLYRVI